MTPTEHELNTRVAELIKQTRRTGAEELSTAGWLITISALAAPLQAYWPGYVRGELSDRVTGIMHEALQRLVSALAHPPHDSGASRSARIAPLRTAGAPVLRTSSAERPDDWSRRLNPRAATVLVTDLGYLAAACMADPDDIKMVAGDMLLTAASLLAAVELVEETKKKEKAS